MKNSFEDVKSALEAFCGNSNVKVSPYNSNVLLVKFPKCTSYCTITLEREAIKESHKKKSYLVYDLDDKVKISLTEAERNLFNRLVKNGYIMNPFLHIIEE